MNIPLATDIERFEEVLDFRRRDMRRRTVASMGLALCSLGFIGWWPALTWLVASLAVQVLMWPWLDWVAKHLKPGRFRVWISVGTFTISNGVNGSIALFAATSSGSWGIEFGQIVLLGLTFYGALASGRSSIAFNATATPYGVIMLALAPVAYWSGSSALMAAGFAGVTLIFLSNLHAIHRTSAQSIDDLEDARMRAEAATAAKSSFVAIVSHELRTPISGILAGAGELERSLVDKTGRSKAALINESARMMRTLLNDLLDMSKIEAGRMSMENIVFDLRRLVQDTVRFWAPETRKKGLRFRVEGGRHLPRWVEGDPTRVRQIINNLISNALKFTDAGSVTLRLGAFPSEDGRTSKYLLEVIDTGRGMSGEQVARLFGAFDQLSASTARTHGGTGLGLHISLQLAELMGGALKVTSQEGVGTTFGLVIPLPDAQAPVPTAALLEREDSGLRVLVVDDHHVNRQAFSLILQPVCSQIATVENGKEALSALASSVFDLVLMDLNMPVLGGLEATRRLRSQPGPNRKTVVIALTASVSPKEIDACIAAGMDAFVMKPVGAGELLAAIDQALQSHDHLAVVPEFTSVAIGA